MRRLLWIVLVAVTGCGGGGDGEGGLPPERPSGTISGVAFDGLITDGVIEVRSFHNGVRGAALGTGSINQNGEFEVSLQSEDIPVLLEVRGGRYVEEASGKTVAMQGDQVLRAAAHYVSGQRHTVHVTTMTNLAAGLAVHKIRSGMAADQAVREANDNISALLGFNILTTKPLDITSSANATPFTTAGHEYGFIAAAISSWTAFASDYNSAATHGFYTSMGMAQLMYSDVAADGVLDGEGEDALGIPMPLNMGLLKLDQTVYRYGLAAHIVAMAKSARNRTGLTDATMLDFARKYAARADAIWGNVGPLGFSTGDTIVSVQEPIAGQWKSKTFTVRVQNTDVVPIWKVAFDVDGATLGVAPDAANPAFQIDSTKFSDGQRTITIRVTNHVGVVTYKSVTVGFDNTPPIVSGGCSVLSGGAETWSPHVAWSGSVSDLSGLDHIKICISSHKTFTSSTWSATQYFGDTKANGSFYGTPLYFVDKAGNIAQYHSANNGSCGYLAAGAGVGTSCAYVAP